MAGCFEGLSDLEWKLFEDIFYFLRMHLNVAKECLMHHIVMYELIPLIQKRLFFQLRCAVKS